MTIYKFPSDFGRGREPKKEKSKVHHPEFIDIEDIQGDNPAHEEENVEYYTSVGELEKINLPFLLRIFTIGISVALLAGTILLLALTVVFALLTLATFNMVPAIKLRLIRYWRLTKRMFVTAFGLLIMTFSPALGLGFITLYFALQGESVEGNFLEKFFRQN